MVIRVGINGLGRIGRCVIRALYELGFDSELKLVAVNALSPIDQYAHLLKYDSVHGKFLGSIDIEGDNLIINGDIIRKTSYANINEIPWQDVDIVFECTGKFNNREATINHIKNDVQKVLVSAPCKDADDTIIYGVNHEKLKKDQKIISIGSCTTNCLAVIASILNTQIGIQSGFVTTIHAYTNDQNILDNSHKDFRRARACGLSMIPTTTGAAKTIGEIIPELEGKLDGTAIRVPVPNVSLIDFCFIANKAISINEVNTLMEEYYRNDKYGILEYLTEKLVSIDLNHNSASAIFDPFETKVVNNNFVRVLSWYDNEWAYSIRMLDIAKFISRQFM